MIYHKPVLLKETIDLLITNKGGFYIDATGGGGGHAREILKNIMPDGKLLIIDRDQDAISCLEKELEEFDGYTIFINDNFVNISNILSTINVTKVNGILFDLGVSSFQIDSDERGFSFMKDGPLDMRMNKEQKLTAKDIVNSYTMPELSRIIYEYGDERSARRIAKRIILERPISTTGKLAELIKRSCSVRNNISTIARTFQAIRIETNKELESLTKAISDSIQLLNFGSRIAVLSYHSGEDRIVKNIFRQEAASCICDKRIPKCSCNHKKNLEIITKKPITASVEEISGNSRARSAKLRIAQRI